MIDRFEQLSFYIGSIYRHIHKIEKDVMQKYKLRGAFAQYLVALSHYPDGITATKLCDICDKDKAATSRIISELEESDLIERISKGTNSYRANLLLTPKGKDVTDYVVHSVEHAVRKAGEGLCEEDRRIFYNTLRLIEGNLRGISNDGIED